MSDTDIKSCAIPATESANDITPAIREVVVEKLTTNLKTLYPLAQRADEELDILRKQNKGKFQAVFHQDSPFETKADSFLPYMVEVAGELSALMSVADAEYKSKLKVLMHKVQLLNGVLAQFHAITDDNVTPAPTAAEPTFCSEPTLH